MTLTRCITCILILAALVCAQTTTTSTTPATTTACPSGSTIPYTYFGSAVVAYNGLLGAGVSAGSSFGVKTGACSNAMLDTTVWTGISGAAKTGYSLLEENLEYDLAKSGNWVFGADGALGVTQVTTATGSTTSAMFAGGGHGGYDLGYKLSGGKMHLVMLIHATYSALTNSSIQGAVKANYWAEFRKTF